jgi:hypothetical protein
MTNEEALRLIKSTKYCFVVWSSLTREVIAVRPQESASVDLSRVAIVFGKEADVRGRVFDSATVSMSTLLEEQSDMAGLAERQRTVGSWRTCETDSLIRLLETGEFPPHTSVRRDSRLLIDEIYYARADGLSPQQVARLEAVAAQRYFSVLGSDAAYKLECALAVILNDRPRLERFWRLHSDKRLRYFSRGFAIAAGDLALDLPDVIESFVATVENGWPFASRFSAMLALGKIGAAAGSRAADSIAAHIYDSSESVSTLRDRVLLRIRTPSSDWQTCDSCVRGMVPRPPDQFPGFERCSQCCGLGHTHSAMTQKHAQ